MKDEYILDLKDYLGGGAFGQVYGGICKSTKDPVAIKIIDKTPFINQMSEKTPFHSEITLMANINTSASPKTMIKAPWDFLNSRDVPLSSVV